MPSSDPDYTDGDYRMDRDERRYDEARLEFLKERLRDESDELLDDDAILDRLVEIYQEDLQQLYLDVAENQEE